MPILISSKFNPLLKWTLAEVQKYIDDNNVPQNSLHKKGFISIGCAPCTQSHSSQEKISEPEDGLGNPATKNAGCIKNRRQILENRIKRIEKNNNSW
jgi:3'-phosphoadenosine 5'-phosphosulfate sulfotransferase (PAPS reductase)/FAD synthetase